MQVEYKTEKGNLLFIKVPDKFSHPFMTKGFHTESVVWPEWGNNVEIGLANDEHGQIDLPSLDWQLIGLTNEVIEEQSKMIVDNVRVLLFDKYKDYSKDLFFSNPLDSFKSLMQHLKVYEVNPYENIEEKYFYQRKDEGQSWGDYFVKERIKSQDNVGKWIVLFKPNEKL